VIPLLKRARRIRITYLIIIAVAIQALGLVTTFAPKALEVVEHDFLHTTDLKVHTLDLSAKVFSTTDLYTGGWEDWIAWLAVEGPKNHGWYRTANCTSSCSYKVQYEAPILSCRGMSADEYTVKAYDSSASNNSWTFYDFDDRLVSNGTTWTANNPSFIFNYAPMSFRSNPPTMISTDPPTGVSCQCKDGTYEANVQWYDYVPTVNTTIILYSNGYTSNCTDLDPTLVSTDCNNYKTNANQLCGAFTQSLSGSIVLDTFSGRTSGPKSPLIVEKFANYSLNYAGDGVTYFEPKYANLSEALPLFFANLTLSLLPVLDQYANITVEEIINDKRWAYDAKALFAAYIPAFAAVLAIVAYGLFCINANGRAMDSKFSTLVLTTRNGELDAVYDTAENFDALMGKKLVYAKGEGFVPDASGPSRNPTKEE
jgi:hypothetical protein